MKFDQMVYIVLISFNIDNMPLCVVFFSKIKDTDGKLFCQKFSNPFMLYHAFI